MLEVVDLFCGAGGMSTGLAAAGLRVRAGIDSDAASVDTYRRNVSGAQAIQTDVSDVRPADVRALLKRRQPFVLAGCPPCRLFSQLHRTARPVGAEFGHYLRLVWSIHPDYLVFENVPRIVGYDAAWGALLTRLRRRGYNVTFRVVNAESFGVPQRRRRLVLVAARTPIVLPEPPVRTGRTVREAIGHLPDTDPRLPNHTTMRLSPTNLKRLKATPRDGGRSKPRKSAFDDSYGRMRWDTPAPTITTRCVSFSSGRFGHPEFDRAITVREAAYLQGFQPDYEFSGGVWEAARQVGNAVPPAVAEWLGHAILAHYRG